MVITVEFIDNIIMRKKQAGRTVQFSNLSEDHKAEFIQFLIKNNICFQEGKEECTANIAVKQQPTSVVKKQNKAPIRQPHLSKTQGGQPNTKLIQAKQKKINGSRQAQPLKELTPRNNEVLNRENTTEQKEQLKTPTKETSKLNASSLSCRKVIPTNQKQTKFTPSSVKPIKNLPRQSAKHVSDYASKMNSSSKVLLTEEKLRKQPSKQNLVDSRQEYAIRGGCGTGKVVRKSQICRQRVENKYAGLFEGCEKGRPVRWPLSVLERTVEEIYDDMFTRNTQCLQTKNIGNALRTLTLTSFAQLVEGYFRKRFKGSKLASTNLNNLLYSLSYHLSREHGSVFLRTFQDFLLAKLQHQDMLYYLFARNVLKRQLRAMEKMRQSSKMQGTYFPDAIKFKDISKCLKSIIGRDSQLLNQYRDLVLAKVTGDQIGAYEFLRVLLDDYHQKRTNHTEQEQSDNGAPFQRDYSYDQRNDELTFGEEHQHEHSQQNSHLQQLQQQDYSYQNNNRPSHRSRDFWACLGYCSLQDDLFELVRQKMSRKALQFVQILAADMGKGRGQMQRLGKLLVGKAESLVRAVFEMNKMKWFRELGIADPSDQDINAVEGVQMRLRELRDNPSGRDIGEFCKSVLTVGQLINQLQIALTASE